MEKENMQEEILQTEETEVTVEETTSEVEVEETTLQQKLEESEAKGAEYLNQLQRTMAEFDNFRKRTVKEKGDIYANSVKDVVTAFLPVLDNLERATAAAATSTEGLKEGVDMVIRQFTETLQKLGVEPIEALGNSFDPELHNAVMHVEDASFGVSEVIEEFQKGYVYKDKVIRHSMVKVAN